MKNMTKIIIAAALLGTTVTAASAMQGRDPAYQAARDNGLIGEKPDGYLGFVSSPSASIQALVNDKNNQRREVYTEKAGANGATVKEMAFRSGCDLISRVVAVGEKYQTPAGNWETRTSAPPILDPRCP